MKLSDWTVIKYVNEKGHRYIYGDLDEYMEECSVYDEPEFTVIPKNEWTSTDCMELIDNLFEDINKHSMIGQTKRLIYTTMQELKMTESDINIFMQAYTEKIYKEYGKL